MLRRAFLTGGLTWGVFVAGAPTGWAADDPPVPEETARAIPEGAEVIELVLPDGTPGGRMLALSPHTRVTTSGAPRVSRLDTEIYTNDIRLDEPPGGGIVGYIFARGAGNRVADDLVTAAVSPCELAEFTVGVSSLIPGESFDVQLYIWDGCPNAGGTVIYGPYLEEDLTCGPNEIKKIRVVLPPGLVPPSTTIWVSGKFSTDNAGFVVGAPPTLGFSYDGYDDPYYPCTMPFGGGFPDDPHASFWAKVSARGACETHHTAYMATSVSAAPFTIAKNMRHGDDIALADGIEYCELSTYELGVVGQQGLYRIMADLREGTFLTGPGAVIPRTDRTWWGRGDGRPEVARFSFADLDPPITLPHEFWITWEVNKGDTGVLLVGDEQVGHSSDLYGWEDPHSGWLVEPFPGQTEGIFSVIVNCQGEGPRGACCRRPWEGAEPTCADDVPATACLFGRWLGEQTCGQGDDDPFLPPCGTAPCCWENNFGGSNCTDELEQACYDKINYCPGCISEPGLWFPGEYFCEDPEQHCYPFPCYFAENDCFEELFEIECDEDSDCPPDRRPCTAGGVCNYPAGCENLSCCELVCAMDPFCCDPLNGWDWLCSVHAQDYCPTMPTNDECVTALTPDWWPDGSGGWVVLVQVNNMYMATESYATDPGFCCHNAGVDTRGYGTLWYRVVVMGGSLRIQTCDGAGAVGQDSIIQVFRPEVSSPPADACASLWPLACSDDANCGTNGRMSSICLRGLQEGEILYVLLAAPNPAAKQADYSLTFQSPCPFGTEECPATTCDQALDVLGTTSAPYQDEVPFDCSGDPGTLCLDNATLNCPGEPALEAMKNDVWVWFDPGCTGYLHIETCEDSGPSPDTTIAVYGDPFGGMDICPVDGGWLLGANDDAEVNWKEHLLRPQTCSIGGNDCDTDYDCPLAACTSSGELCTDVAGSTDCTMGYCSWQLTSGVEAECDVEVGCPRVCRATLLPCQTNDDCDPEDVCLAQVCARVEQCVPEICESSCWPGSSLAVPVYGSSLYAIRLGGEWGSEPRGTLKFTCEPDDCNFNGIPDIFERDCHRDGAFDPSHPGYENPDVCDIYIDGWSEDCQPNGIPDECDITEGTSGDDDHNGVPDECEILIALLDVLPGTCPNLWEPGGERFLQAAIIGTESFDVRKVDPESLILKRQDGAGESVPPLTAMGPQIKDVGRPREAGAGECSGSGPDGILDLVIWFDASKVMNAFGLQKVPENTHVELTLCGRLLDGSRFEAYDYLAVVNPPPYLPKPAKLRRFSTRPGHDAAERRDRK